MARHYVWLATTESIQKKAGAGNEIPPRSAKAKISLLTGGGNSVPRSREGCEERVALGVHLDSRVPGKGGANEFAMVSEKIRVTVAMVVQELCRARDVCEEERDGAAREFASHAAWIIPPT